MARTNIVLDDSLIREALHLTKIKTKRQVVQKALEDLVCAERRRKILLMEGKVRWTGNLDKWRRGRAWS